MSEGERKIDIMNQVYQFVRDRTVGIGGSIHQDVYKGELFKIFIKAFKDKLIENSQSYSLTGDSIFEHVKSRFISDEINGNDRERALKVTENICSMWNEWRYALKNFGKLSD